MNLSKLQSEAVNANIIIQKVAYEIANARDRAFKAGEIKDGKTTQEWKDYRDAKVKLSQTISDQIQKAVEETISECRRTVLETLPIYVVGKSSPFEMRNEERDSLLKKLESLSIQSKGK